MIRGSIAIALLVTACGQSGRLIIPVSALNDGGTHVLASARCREDVYAGACFTMAAVDGFACEVDACGVDSNWSGGEVYASGLASGDSTTVTHTEARIVVGYDPQLVLALRAADVACGPDSESERQLFVNVERLDESEPLACEIVQDRYGCP